MNASGNNGDATHEELIKLLEAHGVMATQQRVQIAAVLFACDRHMSAEQVLAEVNQGAGRVSKATVYNTLGLFADKQLVREVIVDPSRIFYDPNTRPHHHFYNVDSGELMDIDPAELHVAGMPELPPGTRAEGVDVVVRIRNQASGTSR